MHSTLSMAIGAICMVLAILAVRALVEADIPRPTWAKQCLVALVVVAAIAGILQGLVVSDKAAMFPHSAFLRVMAVFFKGLMLGLFTPLYMAGQFSTKSPPK